MADVHLTFRINAKSLKKDLDKVIEDKVRKYLREKSNEFVERLTSEVGKKAAESAYGNAPIQLWLEKIPRGWRLVANGEAVGFLEFGAGTMSDRQHPFAKNAPFPVQPGSWSQIHGDKQFVPGLYEYWYFGGQKFEYVAPRRGMLAAYNAMQRDIVKVAKEVFNE